MPQPPALSDPYLYILDVFSSKAARSGGVVRRKRRDLERIVGLDLFRAEIERRGFSAIENAGQVIIFCNAEPIRRFD